MQSVKESLDSLGLIGLDNEDVLKRRKERGLNELPREKKKNFFSIVLNVLKEPMFLLLLICWALYLFLGDIQESFILLGFVFFTVIITVYQENKVEKALDALRDLSSPRALVLRNKELIRIPGKDIVYGDIIILSEGDRVPADCIIVDSNNLFIDESILTGESLAVKKSFTKDFSMDMLSPGCEETFFAYSGTLVVSGRGIGIVKNIGADTEMGKIGKSLKTITHEKTNLEKETSLIVKSVAGVAIGLSILVTILYLFLRSEFVNSILAGITLAMSIIPEELPVVLVLFLGVGAWRMSKRNVLARKQKAIQVLGSATVLCSDKTGTLTQNKMSVVKLYSKEKSYTLNHEVIPEDFHELIDYGILASQKDPIDPMEKALKILLKGKVDNKHIHRSWELIQEYPISKELLSISHVWKNPLKHEFIVSAKGAPEAILDLCKLSDEKKEELINVLNEFSKSGLRVIGIAKTEFLGSLPEKQSDFVFDFLGFIGFEDPIREGVVQSVKDCYNAGIRVIMITGDYSATAQNIANEIGIKNPHKFITGNDINKMSDEELKFEIKNINLFVRVIPEQKLRIVNALKANGEIVAMTGDGVNDAPALKAADIGVAMGERGTDVAREAADIVLLNDDFSSIVNGIRLGRRIFDNLRKAFHYLFAVHVPIVGITFFSVIFGYPLILFPVHILFLELIIDPSSSIVFESEKEEKGIMNRKPRPPHERIVNKKSFFYSIFQGLSIFIGVILTFIIIFNLNKNIYEARALCFTTLIFSNLFLIINSKSNSRGFFGSLFENKALWAVIIGALIFLIATLYIPFLMEIFGFGTLHLIDILIALFVSLISTFWFGFIKKIGK